MLVEKQYGPIYILFYESFDHKAIGFDPYYLLRQFWLLIL